MEARSPTLPRTGTISVSPHTRRETTDCERTKIRVSPVSDRLSRLLFGFCNIVNTPWNFNDLEERTLDYYRTSAAGQSSFSQQVLRWLTSLSVHSSTRAEVVRHVCGIFECHSCAGISARISLRV